MHYYLKNNNILIIDIKNCTVSYTNFIMELLKTEYSQNKGNGELDKLLLRCDEPNYYKLTELIYISQNERDNILEALYECKINVV